MLEFLKMIALAIWVLFCVILVIAFVCGLFLLAVALFSFAIEAIILAWDFGELLFIELLVLLDWFY